MRKRQPALFKGRHFELEIVVASIRWYLRYALSYRDVEELMAERNLRADHVTIWRCTMYRNWPSAVAESFVRSTPPGEWTKLICG